MEKSLALILLQLMYESTTLDFCDLCKEIGTVDHGLVVLEFGNYNMRTGVAGGGKYTRCQKCIDNIQIERERCRRCVHEIQHQQTEAIVEGRS